MLNTIGDKLSKIVEARWFTERLDAILEYFGLDCADEHVLSTLTHTLRPDGVEPDVVFERIQRMIAVVAVTTIIVTVAVQIRIAATREPAPIVGSYYIDHNEGQR